MATGLIDGDPQESNASQSDPQERRSSWDQPNDSLSLELTSPLDGPRSRREMLHTLADRYYAEKRRADDAERMLQELIIRLKTINEARLQALHDAAKANEELKLYKIQLRTAQNEIYKAQDTIEAVDRQRYNAEMEAAKFRSKTRRLNDDILMLAAREEAWKLGLQEGLNRGRSNEESEYAEEAEEDALDDDVDFYDETVSSNDSNTFPARPPSMQGRPPSRTHPSPSLVPVQLPSNSPTVGQSENIPPLSTRSGHTRPSSRLHATRSLTPAPLPGNQSPSSQGIRPPENVRPVSIRSGYTRPSSRQHATPSLTQVPLPGHQPPPSQSIPGHPSESVRPVSVRSGYTRPSSTQRATPSLTPTPLPGNRSPSSQSIRPPENVRPVSIRSGYTRPSSRQYATPSLTQVPLPGHQPPPSQSISPSENVRPVSIRSGHTRPSSRQHVSPSPIPVPTSNTRPSSPYRPAPPDNFIPSLDADNKIRIPPPFEFQRAAMTPERPVSPQLPAMSDSSSQEAVMIPGPHAKAPQQHRNRYHRRHSSSESNSSTLSALDIINDRPPGIGTPMSIIPEVASVQSSAIQLPDGDHHSRRQRSFGDSSAHTLNLDDSQHMEAPITRRRPHSRSSYAGSTRNAHLQPETRSGNSYDSSPPNITVQPSSRRTSVVQSGSTNTSLHNTALASVLETHDPSMLVPGGYHAVVDPMLSPTHSGRYTMNSYAEINDDAVASPIGTDPLTTPPARGHVSMEPDWSGAAASAAHVPLLPSNSLTGPVPRGLNVDAIMDSRKKTGKGNKRK